MAISEEKLNQLLGRFVTDFGGALHAGMVVIGEALGLYKALAEAGPSTSSELAERTNTSERYVREWLASQAAALSTQPTHSPGHAAMAHPHSGWIRSASSAAT